MHETYRDLLSTIRKLYESVLENPNRRLESMADRIPDLLGIIECQEREIADLKARLAYLDNLEIVTITEDYTTNVTQ